MIEEDPEFLDRFIQEGRLAVSLHHKNIVRIFDAGKSGESYYLVMELLEGNDALHILKNEGAFPVDKVLEIGCAVADALIEAHEHGVIHRDIKPDNIMITPEGKIKLADLGLAKKLGDEFGSTLAGTTIGTPNYMSPEQAMNSSEANAGCDIYSLGATLYHMITGTLPFEGESIMAVMMKHANEPLEHPQKRKADLPENICSVIMKMMDKNPAKRYQTCEEVLAALNKIRYAPSESEKPKTVMVLKTKKFKKPIKKIEELEAQREERKELQKKENTRKPVLIAILAAVLLIPVLFVIFNPRKDQQPEKSVEVPVEKIAQKENKKTPDNQNKTETKEPKVTDLLSQLNIRKKQSVYTFYENGVLEIIPRDSFAYSPFNGIYGNCKLSIEYKFTGKNMYGKIALFRNEVHATNLIIASDHKWHFTGNIEIKNMKGSKAEFIKVFEVKENNESPVDQWNKMEVIMDDKSLIVILNGKVVTNYSADYSEGLIAILADNKSHLFIRKFELTPLK